MKSGMDLVVFRSSEFSKSHQPLAVSNSCSSSNNNNESYSKEYLQDSAGKSTPFCLNFYFQGARAGFYKHHLNDLTGWKHFGREFVEFSDLLTSRSKFHDSLPIEWACLNIPRLNNFRISNVDSFHLHRNFLQT